MTRPTTSTVGGAVPAPVATAALATLSVLWIGGFLVGGAFARDWMAESLIGRLSVGWAYAMTIPPFVLIVTAVYSKVARATDPKEQDQ